LHYLLAEPLHPPERPLLGETRFDYLLAPRVSKRKQPEVSGCILLAVAQYGSWMSPNRGVGEFALLLCTASALLTSCGGRLAPLPADGGADSESSADASLDADGNVPEGAPTDERGPPPVPVCTGDNSMCIPPDAGVIWNGASVIKCQPENYVGPWTLVLERLVGTTYEVVQKQVVQEPGFGWTFYDTTDRAAQLTFRVCVVVSSTTEQCGAPFKTQGPAGCSCEPTSCYLEGACDVTIDDQCNGTLTCGACSNGAPCDPDHHWCCPRGFMPDGWGNCVCAPPPGVKGCAWSTVDCSCYSKGAPIVY
jgi:hypothetical protein